MRRRDFLGLIIAATATAATGVSFAQENESMRKEGSNAVYRADISGLPQITKIIDTTSGPVRGLINDGVHTFKGIRYGAPPVGRLRWMPPQRPAPSKVVLDCSDYGAPAMQMVSGATAAPTGDYGMLMARRRWCGRSRGNQSRSLRGWVSPCGDPRFD
jgi:Carboxylesterase family